MPKSPKNIYPTRWHIRKHLREFHKISHSVPKLMNVGGNCKCLTKEGEDGKPLYYERIIS